MASVFEKVPGELNFPKEEREVLGLWRERRVFERSLEERAGRPTFLFYEGPPTANGLPHNGHVLTRVIKDLFPRYKTMRGYRVPRKAGWDTHGLPVEVEVEKELRIHGKAAIEAYGVEPFARKCIESVFRYTAEWEELTRRIGFWVDLDQAYVTYHRSYVESVWWVLSELFAKKLLYKGNKVVWWWAQGGTALSSGEVGLGYREVDDPSVYVAFPFADDPSTSLLVWTTTPWTLPSNMYAAVRPDFDYVVVRFGDRKLVIAEKLRETIAKKLKTELVVEKALKGSELLDRSYEPPFELYRDQQAPLLTLDGRQLPVLWRVIAADFVTLDTGTGIVHVAPAFGEDDYKAHTNEGRRFAEAYRPFLCAVDVDGTFKKDFVKYAGRWVKDCDKELTHDLKSKGLLVHAETYRHDYPFCWRADQDPLIQYARPAWYIKTTALKDEAIRNNRAVNWLPDHIKEGRFGDFLANNVDWALSRERYWGTPLNIWICENEPEHMVAPSSVAEIERLGGSFDHFREAKRKDPSLSDHLIVHKPWIDEVTFACPECGGRTRRVPDVIDCWFDSGCMPFAQWGYPHVPGSKEIFAESFPADFISEAIDQTRGWFYSLLMISTLVFQGTKVPHPYKTCIVLGHVCDKEGKKESKSKGNYTPPDVILDEVQMDFAVLAREEAEKMKGVAFTGPLTPFFAWIAPEDLEGLDLVEPAKLVVRGPAGERDFVVHTKKGLPRRVVVLGGDGGVEIGVRPTATPDVKPVEVPRLPPNERVTLRDPSTPAPGADAFRWFFYASSPPWSNTRHSLSNVRALQKEFAVKLRNVYSFFTIYANIDGFDPHGDRGKSAVPFSDRAELDRWILGELSLTTRGVTRDMDAYDVYSATQKLGGFVDALSNWYVRRTRARFWKSGWDRDKASAYQTLHESLVTVALLAAPFVPFGSEAMYQNLVVRPAGRAKVKVPDSVHLCLYPEADEARIDEALSRKIGAVRDLVSLGLQVRTQAKIKVRQPLRQAHVIVAHPELLDASARAMLSDELNVLSVEVCGPKEAERFVDYRVKPSFRSLGQKGLGKEAQALKKTMGALGSKEAAAFASGLLERGEGEMGGVKLDRSDVEIEFLAKEGFAAAGDRAGVVVLDTRLDDELRRMGFARELQNRLQGMRKEIGLEYTDRIKLWVAGGARVGEVLGAYGKEIASEVLAVEVTAGKAPDGAYVKDVEVEGEKVVLGVVRA